MHPALGQDAGSSSAIQHGLCASALPFLPRKQGEGNRVLARFSRTSTPSPHLLLRGALLSAGPTHRPDLCGQGAPANRPGVKRPVSWRHPVSSDSPSLPTFSPDPMHRTSASGCVVGGLSPGLPLGGGHWLLGPPELQGALLGAQATSHHPKPLPFLLQERFCVGRGLWVETDRQTDRQKPTLLRVDVTDRAQGPEREAPVSHVCGVGISASSGGRRGSQALRSPAIF